jgi:hypothetical protein
LTYIFPLRGFLWVMPHASVLSSVLLCVCACVCTCMWCWKSKSWPCTGYANILLLSCIHSPIVCALGTMSLSQPMWPTNVLLSVFEYPLQYGQGHVLLIFYLFYEHSRHSINVNWEKRSQNSTFMNEGIGVLCLYKMFPRFLVPFKKVTRKNKLWYFL